MAAQKRWQVSAIGAAASMAAVAGAPSAGAAERNLEGVWTNGWYTNLERPKEFTRLVVTPQEAEAWEAPRRALGGMPPSKPDDIGQSESEFAERGPGMLRVRGEIRSSVIIEPADGKIPWRPEVREQLGVGKPPTEKFAHVEERPTDERCLTARGAGAPILSSPDTNFIQIIQTRDHVVIVSEKNHDARVIHLKPPMGPALPAWMGTSVGRWEGASLVVETAGLRPGLTRLGLGFTLSDKSRVTERFTPAGAGELHYEFTVEDASLYTAPFRGEDVFRASDKPMYEFACHEGNYSLASILSAARQAEARQAHAAQTAGVKAASAGP